MKKTNLLLLFIFMMITQWQIKAQTCASPKMYTAINYVFSALDSFYMQPCFIKFNAPNNNIITKIKINNLTTYPNYDFELYRDSCSNLGPNLLSSTITTSGDTAIIKYNTYNIGQNYLIRLKNNNISPPDTVSRFKIVFLFSSSSTSSIGVCPSTITTLPCELVCNGSFENLTTTTLVATLGAGIGTSQIIKGYGWGNGNTTGTADLFWNSGSPNAGNNVPCNWFGTQSANTGTVYAGVATAANYDYAEYIETKLVSTMQAGTKYQISMYVSRSDFQNPNNKDISIYLTNTIVSQPGAYHLTITPSAVFSNTVPLNDAINWQKIAFCYTATGTENYLTIGQSNLVITSSITAPTSIGSCNAPGNFFISPFVSYIYIDDVSVSPVTNSISVTTGSCRGLPTTFSLSNSCLAAGSYTWNFGDNSPLFVGGPNPAYTYTSNGTYTVSVTSSLVCGVFTTTTSINTPTCYYCSTSPTVSYASYNGTLVPTNTTITTPLLVTNDITIPSGVTMVISNEVLFTPNVKIFVDPGGTINLRGAHLYACTADLWGGIVIKPSGKMLATTGASNTNLIEDALTAIDITANNTSTIVLPNYILDIKATAFNKNYISISINNYTLNATNYPFLIRECVFTSRDFTYTPTTWPKVSNTGAGLRALINPTNGLAPPCTLQNASVANLKNPYNSQPAHIGIKLNLVGQTNGSTYRSIQIGSTAAPVDYNVFDNIGQEIEATNSNLRSLNNIFQSTQQYTIDPPGPPPPYTFGGNAIRNNVTNDFNSRLDLAPSVSNYSYGNRFYNCHFGVNCDKTYEIICRWATFRSTQTVTNTSFSTTGIVTRTNRFNYNITDNSVANIASPIIAILSPNSYSFTSGGYGIYAKQLLVQRNNIDAQITPTTAVSGQYVNQAISLTCPSVYTFVVATANCVVQTNTLNRVYRGIEISGISYTNHPVNTSTNTIFMVDDAFGNPNQVGILYTNNKGGIVTQNTISANVYSNTSVFTNGYYGESTNASSVTCNTFSNCYYACVFSGANNNAFWRANSMTTHSVGLYLVNNAILGNQGNSTNASDNKWNSWGASSGTYVDFISDAANAKLWVKLGAPWTPPNNGGLFAFSYGQLGNLNVATGTYVCGGSGPPPPSSMMSSSNTNQNNMLFSVSSNTNINNEVRYIEHLAKYKFVKENNLYNSLGANDQAKYNSLNSGSAGKFYDAELAIYSGNLNQVITLLASVSPTNSVEQNYKNFYTLYHKHYTTGLNTQELVALNSIAQLCPGIDGSVVYQARALRSDITKQVYTYNTICNRPISAERALVNAENGLKQSTSWDISIFPNPNAGNFNIVSNLPQEKLEVTVMDINGKVIFKKEIVSENFVSLVEVDLNNGVYIAVIKNESKNIVSKKIVVYK